MRRNTLWLVVLVVIAIPGLALATETYTTIFADGKAPITIDGVLSDWDLFNVLPVQIIQVNSLSKPGFPRSKSDLSAFFRCFSDTDFFYFAVNITDDKLIFGEEPFGSPFNDDCVELLFYGEKTGVSPLKIWVSESKDGKVRLEGREPQEKKTYPYMWAKQGVLAGLKITNIGYDVEIAVPREVLDSIGWLNEKVLNLNVGVYDDDDGGKYESILQWMDISTNSYNKILFGETLTISNAQSDQRGNINKTTQELEIVITPPNQAQNPEDQETQYEIALAYERAGLYSEAIEELGKVFKSSGSRETQNKAKLALARNHFFKNENAQAKQLCEELLKSETDAKRALDAKMILLSIDRKQSNFMSHK